MIKIKFYNEKSEALYYKLLDKFGKEVIIGDKGSTRLRFPIDSRLGVSKTLFVLADYTEYEFSNNMWKDVREKLINKIRSLDLEVSEISKVIMGHSYTKIFKEALKRSEIEIKETKKNKKITEKDIKDLIENFIIEKGYLLTKKVLTEELEKLDEKIKEQQNNLKAAESILSEAETEKEKCLRLLYGAE